MAKGSYTTANGTRYYSYTLDTLFRVSGDTFTLCLPNVDSLTTRDGQTLQVTNGVQITKVSITALNNSTDRYTDSDAVERTFS